MRHPVYTAFGALLVLLLVGAELRGWSLLRPTEVKNSPHSIRDNPGAYRPHYHFYGTGRYLRGK
jgi:hypothetical protein